MAALYALAGRVAACVARASLALIPLCKPGHVKPMHSREQRDAEGGQWPRRRLALAHAVCLGGRSISGEDQLLGEELGQVEVGDATDVKGG